MLETFFFQIVCRRVSCVCVFYTVNQIYFCPKGIPPRSVPAVFFALFFRYVVVLTKADKSDNSVSRQVLDGVVSALREAGVSRTPVVLTSAASKLGRDGMWRYGTAFSAGAAAVSPNIAAAAMHRTEMTTS